MASLRLLPRLRMVLWAPGLGAGLVAVGLLAWLLPGLIHDSVGRTLHSSIELIVPALHQQLDETPEGIEGPALQAWVRSIGDGSGIRITLIDASGRVLADSARDVAGVEAMDNHGSRPEVSEARAVGNGVAVRRSDTTGEQYVYAARMVTRTEGEVLVVRAARSLVELEILNRHLLRMVLVMLFGAGIGTLLVVSWIRRRILRPFDALVKDSGRLAQSDLSYRLETPRIAELAILASSLNQLTDRAQEHVRAVDLERRRLAQILEGMREGVLVTGEGRRPIFVNGSWYRLFDLPGEAEPSEVLELARRPALFELLQSVLESGAEAEVEVETDQQSIAVSGHPVEAFGGVLMVARDITGERELGRVRRDFVTNVSHELKTPLAIIRAAAETVQSIEDDSEAQDRFVQRIVEQCLRLEDLLGDLLTLSRLESTEIDVERFEVDLADIARRAVSQLEPLATRRNVELRLESTDPLVVYGDRYALERLFLNLLSNGIKYGADGGYVTVRLGREGGQARIEVEDGGRGIESSELDRIFERFYRVDKGRDRKAGGSGLGLSIVKHVVQTHGGEISVESRPGQGSCFRVLLPLRTLDSE